MIQLIHDRFHVPLHPVLHDKAVADAIEEHQVTQTFFPVGAMLANSLLWTP